MTPMFDSLLFSEAVPPASDLWPERSRVKHTGGAMPGSSRETRMRVDFSTRKNMYGFILSDQEMNTILYARRCEKSIEFSYFKTLRKKESRP